MFVKCMHGASPMVQGKHLQCRGHQCRGHQFNPWSRRISHAKEQLSPCTQTTEPVLKSP